MVVHNSTNRIKIQRGVRQGDTISPKLFLSALANIFKTIDWSDKGISINKKKTPPLDLR